MPYPSLVCTIKSIMGLVGHGSKHPDPYLYPLVPVPATRTGYPYLCRCLDNSDHQMSTTKPRDSGYPLTHDDDPPWMNDDPPRTRQPPTHQ